MGRLQLSLSGAGDRQQHTQQHISKVAQIHVHNITEHLSIIYPIESIHSVL